MTKTQQTHPEEGSLGRDLLYALRYYAGSRRGLLLLAGLAIAAGLIFNWSWLAAVGIAPILVGVLPCLVMCGLGLCMSRLGGKSCSSSASTTDQALIEDAGRDTKTVALEASPDDSELSLPDSSDATLTTDADLHSSNKQLDQWRSGSGGGLL